MAWRRRVEHPIGNLDLDIRRRVVDEGLEVLARQRDLSTPREHQRRRHGDEDQRGGQEQEFGGAVTEAALQSRSGRDAVRNGTEKGQRRPRPLLILLTARAAILLVVVVVIIGALRNGEEVRVARWAFKDQLLGAVRSGWHAVGGRTSCDGHSSLRRACSFWQPSSPLQSAHTLSLHVAHRFHCYLSALT